MRRLWERIENWYKTNAPELLDVLNSGASEQEIALAEQKLGVSFPDDFRESLKIHNGQDPDAPRFLYGYELLSLSRIVDEWNIWRELLKGGHFDDSHEAVEPDEGIKQRWWDVGWIPITADGAGNNYCLDLAPTPEGNLGQIIDMDHEVVTRSLLAPSFSSWLEGQIAELETGNYELVDGELDEVYE